MASVLQLNSERDCQLDVIRGVAILGIVFLNVFSFAIPSLYSFDLYWHQHGISGLDAGLYQIQQLFLQGRFRTILTLLFGVGLWLLATQDSAENGHLTMPRLQLVNRRYLVLAVFGFCHLSFFWTGDITFWYALSALMLLAFGFLKLTALVQWRLGLALVALTIVLNYAAAWTLPLNEPSFSVGLTDDEIIAARALQLGPMLPLFAQMFFENLANTVGFIFNLAWLNIGIMLMGISLYRQGFFKTGMRRWQEILLLVLALMLDALGLTISNGTQSLANFWYDFSALLMALVFCSWLVKWQSTNRLQHWLQLTGQMALSLYFLQTILFLTWFRFVNPDWYANSERWQLLLLGGAVALVSFTFAVVWRYFFTIGPLEWCWRRLYRAQF